MYQNLTSEMKDSFKPFMNIFDIQARTAQKLVREQLDFMSECLDVSTRQVEQLRGGEGAGKFFRVPVETGREIGERWTNTAGRQWNVLMEARDELTGEAKTFAQDFESTVKQASAQAESTVKQAASEAENVATEATGKSQSSNASKSSGSAARKS